MKEKKKEEEAVSDGCGALLRLLHADKTQSQRYVWIFVQKPSTKSNSAQAHGANLNIVRTQTTSERHEPEILVNRLRQHPICHQILKKNLNSQLALMTEGNSFALLNQLEDILDSDPLIDEVGFIHPSQFVTLNREAGGSLASSVQTTPQSEDGVLRPRVPEVNSSETVFWCRDHKLGISTQVLLPLYNAAKHAFMASLERYKSHSSVSAKKDESGGNDMSSCFSPSLNILERELMKHSRALLLLSCDFVTAWNSRKLVLSKKNNVQIFFGELFLSALVLSYAPKSESSWSHRRWVIKMLAGKCSNLREIMEKETELVTRIVEVNFSSGTGFSEVLEELNRSRDWARLHIADNSCFHYRTRLMLKMLEESRDKESLTGSPGHSAELRRMWKEELDWNELLIKRHIGREALWLHRRFLSLCWMKYFATDFHDVSCRSYHKDSTSHEISVFMNNELGLVRSCSTIRDNDFEDFQAHATFSSTYILWLIKHLSESLEIELQEKLPLGELKTIMNDICPEKLFLWHSLQGTCEST
ncbi:hypothetical protein RHGRI_025398 [Rhododendron griersonianum]|uniref:Uncharacterized protein n=1 Tax=Rhododendron griersonianum TaxID=479676 RepID=A0AAV6IUA9_9ERIC|nr:hypothetical protein RHGRI_025398 [Rhododendron griersonianum]